MKFALLLAVGLFTVPFQAMAQEKSDRLKIINCHDVERNIVRRTALRKCKGDTVSDSRAQEIKESRIRRARGKLQPARALFPGLRMRGSGYGFFPSRDGNLFTSHHDIDGCTRVLGKLSAARTVNQRHVCFGAEKMIDESDVEPAIFVVAPRVINVGDMQKFPGKIVIAAEECLDQKSF
jgi:hypothetical protein